MCIYYITLKQICNFPFIINIFISCTIYNYRQYSTQFKRIHSFFASLLEHLPVIYTLIIKLYSLHTPNIVKPSTIHSSIPKSPINQPISPTLSQLCSSPIPFPESHTFPYFKSESSN